ncbi:hypothetical protein KS4_03910 [Poriferisphaera corsica]|uniref:Rieske domain-containing protein n=1 Tax=Poriferisphaera corsica TaxID=2528020 RepID=A0A517YQ64_9BACT|nr:hypothetical protein [Poriferisphaera corsica]QDU32359.1 hypothetical protein KS4_03910 [Poriferisphaera corsica]
MDSPAPKPIIITIALLLIVLLAYILFAVVPGRQLGPGSSNVKTAIQIPTARFNIGSPSQYKDPTIYTDYLDSRQVYLVTNSHNMLVALAARCPKDNNPITFDRDSYRFECHACRSRFTSDGLRLRPYTAPTSLARLQIAYDPDNDTLTVRPHRFFFHENKKRDTWSNPHSMYHYITPNIAPVRR